MNKFNNPDFEQYDNSYSQQFPNITNMFNQQQPRIRTSKLFVTSLQEALSKPAPLGSQIVYHHQDGILEFEVTTDFNGKKYYDVYKRVQENLEPSTDSVSRKEFEELKDKLKKLEEFYAKQPSVNGSNEDATRVSTEPTTGDTKHL